MLLHERGSSSPYLLGGHLTKRYLALYPLFIVKDVFGLCLYFIFLSVLLGYAPDALGHPDNYLEANPLATPLHIVPEWYFLPFYALLRAVPDKLSGVLVMLASILILIVLPYIFVYIRSIN